MTKLFLNSHIHKEKLRRSDLKLEKEIVNRDLRISAHIRCRDISVNADQIMDLLREHSSESLKLRPAQVPWVAAYSSLGTSIRDVSNSCLPRHQLR